MITRAYLERQNPDLVAELVAEGRAEGAAAERQRLTGIEALFGPGDIKAECMRDTTVTVAEAALRLNAAMQAAEQGAALATAWGRSVPQARMDR